ncbi:hypothetical protein WJX77_012493 [Trebouxia sp. C0004]
MAVHRHLWHVVEADLPAGVAGQLDAQAATHWNTFYQQNKTKFFKDRHYLEREFPELGVGNCTILEVGCGVGNTAFPLLELNKRSRVYACDFAHSAVEMVKANPKYSSQRIHAFVADITCDDLRTEVPVSSVDMCTMVFVLSAITPAKMPAAVANVARVLKAGTGRVLVRDYAEGDLAQLRLSGPTRNQRLSHNFYVRSDGTQAYYFSKESLMKLFLDAGFTCEEYKVHERQIENRRQEVTMHRRWVQAVFTYAAPQATPHKHISNAPLQVPAEHQSGPNPNQAADAGHAGSCKTSYGCTSRLSHRQQASSQVDHGDDDDDDVDDDQSALPTTMLVSPASQQPNLQHCHSTGNGHAGPSGQQQAQIDDSATLELVHQQSALPDGLPAAASSQQAHGIAASQQLPENTSRQHPDGPDGMATQRQRQNTGAGAEPSAIVPPLHQAEKQYGVAAAQLPPDAVQRQEWEEGGTTPEEGPLTGSLFVENGLQEVIEDVEIGEQGLVARVVSVSRQHRHTLEHTGLMRWESCLPLARFLLTVPSLTQGKQVLEVGCGVNPLCCLAALRHSRKYIATDGSLQALQGLVKNLDLNCRNVVMERARTYILAWGNAQQEAILADQFLSFDAIIGADVVYAPEAIASLFATCSALLSPSVDARLILCHIYLSLTVQALVFCVLRVDFWFIEY